MNGHLDVRTTAKWTPNAQARDFRHLALHVAKTAGKICAMAEELDHEGHADDATPNHPGEEAWRKIDAAVIPDLVILAAMLADLRGVDLDQAVYVRGSENTRRA